MIEILNRFLIQHKSISIPGLGTLHVERVPATLSDDGLSINPPGDIIRFDKYFDAPDKEFFTYLSSHQGVPDFEAMQQYNQFAQDFRANIMSGAAEWKGLGHFSRNASGEIEFVQTEARIFYPAILLRAPEPPASPAVVLEDEPVVAEDAEDSAMQTDAGQQRADRARMLAGWIILAVAIAGLIFYFANKGFHLNAVGNQTSLPTSRP